MTFQAASQSRLVWNPLVSARPHWPCDGEMRMSCYVVSCCVMRSRNLLAFPFAQLYRVRSCGLAEGPFPHCAEPSVLHTCGILEFLGPHIGAIQYTCDRCLLLTVAACMYCIWGFPECCRISCLLHSCNVFMSTPLDGLLC